MRRKRGFAREKAFAMFLLVFTIVPFYSSSALADGIVFDLLAVNINFYGSEGSGNWASLGELDEGDSIDVFRTGTALNIRAHIEKDVNISRVQFVLDGKLFGNDKMNPYLLAGDNGQNLYGDWYPKVGSHTLEVTAFDEQGGIAAEQTINFEVTSQTAGTPTLLQDDTDVAGPSDPIIFININNTLFFSSDDNLHGDELWKSDGTEEGTVLVKDINPEAGSSNVSFLTNVNGTLFFRAWSDQHGYELWKSDGTPDGTVLVKDISQDEQSSDVSFLTNVNGTLFFLAEDKTAGKELWKSDGTADGTVLVKDVYPGPESSNIKFLMDVNGILFFSAHNKGNEGVELWKSDGTAEGTIKITNLTPNAAWPHNYDHKFTNVNGTLFFRNNSGSGGKELWKSNGTPEGTVMVSAINSGDDSYGVDDIVNVNGTVFFTCQLTPSDWQLWRSNGTPKGTVLVKNYSADHPYGLFELINVNGTLFFWDWDEEKKRLWRSDGTEKGTYPVLSASKFGVLYQANVEGTLYFSAKKYGDSPYGIWKSDGTTEGTVLVMNSDQNMGLPEQLTNVKSILFFAAESELDDQRQHLWKLDTTN